MHSNLARHLHTEECNKLIDIYEDCMKQNAYSKYLGKCSAQHDKMNTCIKSELVKRREHGGEMAKKRELENYARQDAAFAAKLKLLEELKAQKAKEESAKSPGGGQK